LSREVGASFGGYRRVARFVIYLPRILIYILDSFLCATDCPCGVCSVFDQASTVSYLGNRRDTTRICV